MGHDQTTADLPTHVDEFCYWKSRRKVRVCADCGSECNTTIVYSYQRGPGDWIKICARCRTKRLEASKSNEKMTRLSESDWDDVADLCEQGAAACETGYEEHTKKARKRAAKWMRQLAMKAQRFAVAAGSSEVNNQSEVPQ